MLNKKIALLIPDFEVGGMPVVASNVGGLPTLIGENGGKICSDKKEFIDAIKLYLNNPTMYDASSVLAKKQARVVNDVDNFTKLIKTSYV